MINLTKFRKYPLLQLEYSLATGCSVKRLLKSSDGLSGNTHFNTFLLKTSSDKHPIDWLEYDQSLNANISVIKNVAKKLTDLEQSTNLTVLEILARLKGKHGTSHLNKLFDDLYCDYWGEVTKAEVAPLLNEFNYWLEYIDGLPLWDDQTSCNDLNSANDLLIFLNQPLFKQLKRLVDVVEVASAHWGLDVGVFKNIMKSLRDSNANFIQEWLSAVKITSHYNAKSHQEYKSLHSWMFLSTLSQTYGYKYNLWASKRQWKSMGCILKEDARPAPVFHYFKSDIDTPDHQIESKLSGSSFGRKISIVSTADDIVGSEGESFADMRVPCLPVLERRIDELGTRIVHTDEGAYYNYHEDLISVPHKELFKGKDSTKAYYATLLHEMVHWTGHESRCKRTFGKSNTDEYAFEELIAEIGSSFLCARFGLTKSVRKPSIQYIANWLKTFDDDKCDNVMEKAATLANRASNYIYVPKKHD